MVETSRTVWDPEDRAHACVCASFDAWRDVGISDSERVSSGPNASSPNGRVSCVAHIADG